jgi:hypothetical protein
MHQIWFDLLQHAFEIPQKGAAVTLVKRLLPASPFDWYGEYLREKARMEELARQPLP